MATDLKAFLDKSLTEASARWAMDLAAHAGDLNVAPSETARSVADIAYETVFVNRMFAARLKGDATASMDGFPSCPSEMRSAQALSKAMGDSVREILNAVGDPERVVARGHGDESSAFAVAAYAGTHMMFHLGQINYIQTVNGDAEIHWA